MSFDQAAQALVAIENASADAYGPLVDSFWNDIVVPSGAPFRMLAPFLAQRSFAPLILERIAARLLQRGVEEAKRPLDPTQSAILAVETSTPAHVMMHSVCTYLIASVQACNALDDVTHVTNAVLCIARAPTAMAVAIKTGLFFARNAAASASAARPVGADGASPAKEKITSIDLMTMSVMGSIIALPLLFKNRESMQKKYQKLIEAFPYDRANQDIEETKQRQSDMEFGHGLGQHANRIKDLLEACLRSGTEARNATFAFVNTVLDASRDYSKMQRDESQLFDRFSLFAFTHALIMLALPILAQRDWFPQELHPGYLFDASEEFALVRFGADAETVISGSEAPERPVLPHRTTAPYHAKFHIFFMTLRAMSICVHSAVGDIESRSRVFGRPEMSATDLAVYAALVGRDTALFAGWSEGASNMLRFLDGTAQWLLMVSRVDMGSGEVDKNRKADAMWAHLPLAVVDTVFDVLDKLIVNLDFHDHPPMGKCGFYEITNVVSLVLLLMGNSNLLPKAYTHLNYPTFLMFLMQRHDRELRNHKWFVTHSLRGCIDCYIMVESCEYDRVNSRHILGIMMDKLLDDPQVVSCVRDKYNNANDSERKLERMTKMMTHETGAALDALVSGLKEMNEIERKYGNQAPPKTDPKYGDYAENMRKVSHGAVVSKYVLAVFTKLLDQFKEGMAQHLVVQQVGAMLVSFLIKLAGKNSSELKSVSMEECHFKPRETLEQLVAAFVRFYDIPDFCRFCVESTSDISLFFDAVERVRRLNLVQGHLMMGLAEMERKMRAANDTAAVDDSVYDDPPEWALCDIMMGMLEDPVFLPESNNTVEKKVIHHHLMDNEHNPFTRQKLTRDELDAYNDTEVMKQRRAELVAKIEAWKAERRAEAAAKKAAAAAAPVQQN